MTIKDWPASSYPASQDADPITGTWPDLADESAPGADDGDEARSSQVEAPRDKLQAVCKAVGADNLLPSGSIRGANWFDGDYAEKATPVDADRLLIEDSAASYAKKWVEAGSLPAPASTGRIIKITDGQPSASIYPTTSYTQIMPETPATEVVFSVTKTGWYRVDFIFSIGTSTTTNVSVRMRLIFDLGDPGEQNIPAAENDSWRTRIPNNYLNPVFIDEVHLDAGSHAVTAYIKEIVTGTSRIIGSATQLNLGPTVILTPL